jgi:hypothetical protein
MILLTTKNPNHIDIDNIAKHLDCIGTCQGGIASFVSPNNFEFEEQLPNIVDFFCLLQ